MHPQSTQPAPTHRPRVQLVPGRRGTYHVESQTIPGWFYTTTAYTCDCPARRDCKHMTFVKHLNGVFYAPKTPAPVVDAPPTRTPAALMSRLQECFDGTFGDEPRIDPEGDLSYLARLSA